LVRVSLIGCVCQETSSASSVTASFSRIPVCSSSRRMAFMRGGDDFSTISESGGEIGSRHSRMIERS
jgi:hypothetical protein